MNDRDRGLPPRVQEQWREWAETEPGLDEVQLREFLLHRIPDRRPRARGRLVLVAAAASLLAMIIGIESVRRSPETVAPDTVVVHETGSNVILVLREGGEPIYIATERTNGGVGE